MSYRRFLLPMSAVLALATLGGCDSNDDEPEATAVTDPITVEQLLARSADTPIQVQGFLLVDSEGARLCWEVLTSYPPQCGAESVELVDLDLSQVEGTTTAEGITWKEGAVFNLERTSDGQFAVLKG